MADAEDRLRSRAAQDLRAAMKARDAARVAALRTLIAALDNAAAVPIGDRAYPAPGAPRLPDAPGDVPRKVLTDEDVRAILEREIAERRNAVFAYETHGCFEEASALEAQIGILESYAAEIPPTETR